MSMATILSPPGATMSGMDASELLTRLCELIEARRWDDLPALLHDDVVCRYVHTGEEFGRDAWVRLNADYPGFDHLVLEDLVGAGERAVARCHVTGASDASGSGMDGQLLHFEVATFISARDGRIAEMTEVWTDVAQTPPEGTRPQ
ncbi:ester cyclase [Ornithinimicrobium faecis]|uniref:Ester cyclase n=1 Tax=Ornithinimicrobium faecis TaxID=2934158 RepID=A0ABY4YV02_9MICO|nr:nuclear transport factor 2 family protein [Ornithinimicrobium sp. HY1793]USQ80596.1 ester cyclase [Ornithinimicrobium sp. HY1793]